MNRWLAFVVVMASFGAGAEDVGDVSLGNYEATWESLDRHRTPEWFKDTKFGIFLYAPHPTASYWKEYQTARGTPEKEYSEASFGYRSVDKLTWDPFGAAGWVMRGDVEARAPVRLKPRRGLLRRIAHRPRRPATWTR